MLGGKSKVGVGKHYERGVSSELESETLEMRCRLLEEDAADSSRSREADDTDARIRAEHAADGGCVAEHEIRKPGRHPDSFE